jgi:2,4-dienoyl-CoA reductase-like NADH-dependent reductase (Old Yellow Enzyme family)
VKIVSVLNNPLTFESVVIPNRIVFQPMEGCDCQIDGRPGPLTVAKYENAARSGCGLIWMEANAVCPEGRTNPGQMMLTRENLPDFKAFVASLRKIAEEECGTKPVIILQLTHSGRQSIKPMIAYRHPIYEETRPVTDENIVSDEYLASLPEKYVASALLAIEACFDGVDVKSCHGYLFQELLSAFNRPGNYGGSFENRTRLYLDSVKAVKAAVPSDFLVVTRLGIADMVPKPYGFGTTEENELDLTESDMLIEKLMEAGIRMLNVTIGNPYYNPHINRPFRAGTYTPPETPDKGLARFIEVESHLKERFPELVLIGSGLSYYRADLMEKSEWMVENGVCDLVGYGRGSIAYPMFYRDWLAGKFDVKKCCVSCSKCTMLMRNKCVSGCAVFNEYYKELYKEKVACKK